MNSLCLNGITIESRESDNFINATQLCKAGGRRFPDWFKLASTKQLIKELENNLKSNVMIITLNLIDKKK